MQYRTTQQASTAISTMLSLLNGLLQKITFTSVEFSQNQDMEKGQWMVLELELRMILMMLLFPSNSVIFCVSEVMLLFSVGEKYLSVYTEEDIKRQQGLLPSDPDKVKLRKSIGISSIHEIRFTPVDNSQIEWKTVPVLLSYQCSLNQSHSLKDLWSVAYQVKILKTWKNILVSFSYNKQTMLILLQINEKIILD